jgi:hypothetical protein
VKRLLLVVALGVLLRDAPVKLQQPHTWSSQDF